MPVINWPKHFAAQSTSNLSIKSYCTEHRLSVSAWQYWKRKLARSNMVPIIPLTPSKAITLEIEGLRIEIRGKSDPEVTARIIARLLGAIP